MADPVDPILPIPVKGKFLPPGAGDGWDEDDQIARDLDYAAIEDEIDAELLRANGNVLYHPFSLQMNRLSTEKARKVQAELEDYYGVSEAIKQGGPQKWSRPTDRFFSEQARGRPFGLYDVDWKALYEARGGHLTNEDIFYGTSYFQYDVMGAAEARARAGGSAAKQEMERNALIHPSKTQFLRRTQTNLLRSQMERVLSGEDLIPEPEKGVVVWDVETGGLSTAEGVSELSYQIMNPKTGKALLDKAGKPLQRTMHVKNEFMNWGVRGSDTHTLSQDIYKGVDPGSVMEYEDAITEFLKAMKSTGYRQMGHNLSFDINNLLAYQRTTSYLDPENAKMFQDFMRASMDSTKFFDTNMLARMLHGPRLISSPLTSGDTIASMQNLLLQTNLLDKMRESGISEKEIKKWLAKLHTGEHDVKIEGQLGYLMNTGQLQPLEGDATPAVFAQHPEWRTAIVEAQAHTPRIPIRSLNDISPSLRGELRTMHYYNEADGADMKMITPMEHFNMLTRGALPVGEADLDTTVAAAAKLRAFYDDLTDKGSFDFTQHARRSLEDPMGEYGAIAKETAEAGVPGTGLGFFDRLLTMAAGRSTAGLHGLGDFESRYFSTNLGEAFGISSWDLTSYGKRYGIRGRKGHHFITMPREVLEDALKDVDHPGLSFPRIDVLAQSGKQAGQNLTMMFEFGENREEQLAAIKRVVDAIDNKDLEDVLGITPAQREEFMLLLDSERVAKRGIQFGFKRDQRFWKAANFVKGAQQEYPTDDQRTALHAVVSEFLREPLVQAGLKKPLGPTEFDVSAVMFGTTTPEELEAAKAREQQVVAPLQRFIGEIRERKDDLSGKKKILPDIETVFQNTESKKVRPDWIKRFLGDREVEDVARSAYTRFFHNPVANHWKVAVPTALIAGMGYYSYKKHKKQSVYDATMAKQPYEREDNYRSQQQEIAQSTSPDPFRASFTRPNYSPLATAGIPRQLNENAIGHTNMSPTKYNYLYGR